MRRGNDPKWIYLPNGDLAGLAMGSDFCAEHEWGVDGMRRLFGCDDSKDGVARRQINTIPKDLRQHSGVQTHSSDKRKKGRPYDAIFLSPLQSYHQPPEDLANGGELRTSGERTLSCAWDEKTFGILAFGEKDKKNLALLWEAFQKKDIAFWPNIGVFHIGGGLIFCIVSRIPSEDRANQVADDLDHKELLKTAEATGIAAELKAVGKEWFSLSPKWAKEIKKNTKFPVVFWLNPYKQDQHKYGWWTVEDLKEWARDQGPIMMTEEERKERRR
jgi:hypothetical protein